jgi:hypothetical protein
MSKPVADAFVNVKIERRDISVLLTAPDLELHPDKFAIEMMLPAMSGAMRSVLKSAGSPAMMRKLREHLVLLCQS